MAELHSRPSATPQPATCYLPTCLMPLRHRATSPLRLILAAYILLAVAYSVVNPLFESPDEIWHYEYVRWLAEGNGLPHPDDVGDAPWHQEGSQPPLYYLSAALLTKPIPTDNAAAVIRYNPHAAIGQAEAWGNRNVMAHGPADQWPWRGVALAAHIARFFSIALGALTVFFTYRIGRTIFPARPAIALCAALLVAFNPQFLFLSAAVNNDNLVTMLSAAGLLLAVTALAQRTPQGDQAAPSWQLVALMGGVAGLAMLSKLSGLFTPLLVGAALTIIAWRLRSWRAWLGFAALAGGTACLVAGWYYVRNQILFGDPLALSAMFDILPRRAFPPTTDELLARAQGIWRSYWAVFGWFNVVTADWIYAVFTGLTLAGLAGLLLSGPLARLTRRTRGRGSLAGRAADWPERRDSPASLALGPDALSPGAAPLSRHQRQRNPAGLGINELVSPLPGKLGADSAGRVVGSPCHRHALVNHYARLRAAGSGNARRHPPADGRFLRRRPESGGL